MSMTNKLKKRLAVAAIGFALMNGGQVYAGGDPITPGGPGSSSSSSTPTVNPPSASTQTSAFNLSYNTSLALNYAASILNTFQPLNFLGFTSTPTVPVTNQGATSQSGEASKGTNTQIITTGGGANDMWSGLKNIGDHVTLIETSTPKKRASSGGNLSEAVKAATEKEENVAKEYLDAVKSGDKAKTAELKDELIKATEEKWKAKDAEESAAREAELAKKTEAEQAAKEAAIKEAQEKLDQATKEGREAYDAWQKAQQTTKDAEAKAEQAARDYLLALKSGDKYTIDAFKEELQKANDALLEAKRNEESAKQAMSDASYKVSRAQTELENTQNRSYFGGGVGGENQQTTQQAVEQPTQQQTVEQSVQQQSGGETAITTQDPLKSRVTELEQKVNDLTKQYRDGFDARDQANLDYLDAKERGASQEEIDRLKAKYDELAKEQGRILDERKAVKAELEAAREAALTPAEKVAKLEQKVDDLTKQYRDGFDARDQANLDYLDAKERGASQEEIDRLKAKYDELAKEQGRILDERRTAKAELQAAREAANAAEPIQQQSGGESNITAELSKMTPAEKVSNLEQKINDLDDKVTDATIASGSALNDYFEAQNRGASQEELDSLKAKYNELDSARDKLDAQRDDAKAKLETAREDMLPPAEKVSNLEQKINDLDDKVTDATIASGSALNDYFEAQNRGASQEELDSLKAKYNELDSARDKLDAQRDDAKARLEAAREDMLPPAERAATLEQKVNDLDDKVTDATIASGSALNDYFEAQNRGASQEELDSLKAKYNELDSARDKLDAQRDDAKARLEAAREAANAAE